MSCGLLSGRNRSYAGRIDPCAAVAAAAPQVLRNHRQLHRDRFREALIAQA